MRFQVPQFIEVEDKIFGPLTLKQFLYLVGSGGIAIVFYTIFPLFITIILAIPVIGLGVALAFYKVNNKPLIEVMEHAFYYALSNKLYTWKKRKKEVKGEEVDLESEKQAQRVPAPELSENKLKDLAWSLDVQESMYSEEHGRK